MGDPSLTSHLKGMALKDADTEGGSGYAEATLRDQGFTEDTAKGVLGSAGLVEMRRARQKQRKKEVQL